MAGDDWPASATSWRRQAVALTVAMAFAAGAVAARTPDQPSVTTSGKPRIARVGKERVVVLPQLMKEALEEFDPTFTVWRDGDYCRWIDTSSRREAPFAVVGDFNGDGKADVALHGHTPTSTLVVAVLTAGGGFEVVTVSSMPATRPEEGQWEEGRKVCEGLMWSLALVRGPVQFPAYPYNDELPPSQRIGPLDLRTDGIAFGFLEQSGTLYYLERGTFRTRPLGC